MSIHVFKHVIDAKEPETWQDRMRCSQTTFLRLRSLMFGSFWCSSPSLRGNKCIFVDPILMKCMVLMITNTNVIYAWVCRPNRFHMLFVLHWNCLTNPTQKQVENRASISVDARTSEQVWEQLSKVFCNSKKNLLQDIWLFRKNLGLV